MSRGGNILEILITGKDQFSPKAQKAQRSAKGLSGAMGSLKQRALGVASGFILAQASIAGVQKLFTSTIGAAMKFEFQLAQIRALTGATTKDTDLLSGAIKDLAKEVGKSPAELGAAAYFILSSGIEDAADAAGVLEIAAKASAIGLGETERVADALTTVLNAYGMEASEAGRVTDIMIEAVKQGKAEADAFAGVLGRVVPLAAQMGISFEEVAANLATFTRLGVSAQEAATGLRAVMNALINPTDQTRETMDELDLSVEGLRTQIKEKGLLVALDSMMQATGGNEEALAKLFPNIRALTSILGTAGVQMDSYKDILAATGNATGNLEEGFGIISDTAQQKVKVAMAELNIVMLELGEQTLPAVAAGAEEAVAALLGLGKVIGALWSPFAIAMDVMVDYETMMRDLTGLESRASISFTAAIEARIEALNADREALRETGKTTLDVAEDTAKLDEQIAALAARLGIEEQVLRVTGMSMEELEDKTGGLRDEIDRAPATWASFEKSLHDAGATTLGFAAATADAAPPVRTLASVVDELRFSVAELIGAQKEQMSTLSDIAGVRTQEQVALEQQINALALEKNAALQAEVGQSSLGGATESTTDALQKQVGALQNLAASMVPQALNNEIIALDRELKVLQLGRMEIEAQVNARNRLAQAQLAMANVANLPALAKQKQLELDRAKILATVGGNVDDLTDKQKDQIASIDNQIQALQSSITVRTLEAELINLQAEASDKNRESMQRELNKIIDQIGATGDLKAQRELYIQTLVPLELLQDIEALERQRTALGNSETGARNAGGAVQSLSSVIGDQISTLELQRRKIDLVTEGWELNAQAMLGLPTMPDVLQGFKESMLVILRAAMLAAIASGDIGLQQQIADSFQNVTALERGTPSFKGGMALLGERGPELAMLPTGTRVLNAGQTAKAMGGGGDTVNIFAIDVEELADALMPYIRRQVA